MNGGSGACTFTRWDVRTDTNEISTYQADGTPAVKKFKEFCDAQTSMGGTFYLGREFRKGIMDTESDCKAKYCNIVGKNHQVDMPLAPVLRLQDLRFGRMPPHQEVSGSTQIYHVLQNWCFPSDCLTEGGTTTEAPESLCIRRSRRLA